MTDRRAMRFWSELRRRKVVQVAIAYAVVGWGAIEVSNVVEEGLGLPAWTDTLVIALVAIGFPIAVVIAWVFDLGPGGVTATPATEQASSQPAPVADGQVVGRFAILERLAEGGMGVIYRARDTTLDRLVALKFLPPRLDASDDAARRFLQEARNVARLDHPNICTIYEVTTLDDGRSFIAMPLYEGKTLSKLMATDARLPAEEAAAIGAQVARGLAAAHAAGIVHRDIKPANLFVTDDGTVKILDFGIAKMTGVDLTGEGAALGTVAYMSPEQVRRREADGRADVWALGVVLYELTSGERPFVGLDAAAVLHGISELDPPALVDLLPETPPSFSDLVGRCLSKDPGERPQSATEVADALAAIGGGAAREAESDDPEPTDVPGGEPPTATLAAEGERRQAAILRAELAGRSVLAESLSPDESDRLVEACRIAIEDVVRSHGGVANLNTGEMLEGLFGIPTTYEDDAVRAVRAAREVCGRIEDVIATAGAARDGLGMRCGVDTGRAVVRPDDTAGSPYRVVGGPAERSARLAAQAPTGQVLVTEDCLRLVGPFFDTEAAPELAG
ncbi:MAG: protein kinase, partial [Gemmatimonadetes bacterium]|nr:protein kinase [Gemmatimonadota bacterium]